MVGAGTVLSASLTATETGERRRFYRPELDALRFFAFGCVLVHHGAGRPGWFVLLRRAGGFGLSLFFLLSAYLITELLLRERLERGTIRLRWFYTRRALRIWPLYYAALLASILIGRIYPPSAISRTAVAGFALFIVNLLPSRPQVGLFGLMWSISVEEQFYLIWPFIAKIRGRASVTIAAAVLIAASGVTIVTFATRTWMLWYNTLVQFLFFGTGALLAVALRGGAPKLRTRNRFLLFGAGLASWGAGAGIGGVGADNVAGLTISRLLIGYGAADMGCVLIFIAFLGVTGVPRPAVFLGKISYGLYVFLFAMIRVASWLTSYLIPRSAGYSLWAIAAVDLAALICCAVMASVSYRFFELPFLRIKEKFTFVASRPAGNIVRAAVHA